MHEMNKKQLAKDWGVSEDKVEELAAAYVKRWEAQLEINRLTDTHNKSTPLSIEDEK